MSYVDVNVLVDSGEVERAVVDVYNAHDGLVGAAELGRTVGGMVRLHCRTGAGRPGPEVLAELLDSLAARLRAAHAAWLADHPDHPDHAGVAGDPPA